MTGNVTQFNFSRLTRIHNDVTEKFDLGGFAFSGRFSRRNSLSKGFAVLSILRLMRLIKRH